MKYLPIALIFFASCSSTKLIHVKPTDSRIGAYGRTLIDKNNDLVLIGSASYAEFNFTSDSCIIFIKNIASGADDYNYVSLEIDNQYAGRLKVDGSIPKPYTIHTSAYNSSHLLRIFRATEPHNGAVVITGIQAAGISEADHPAKKKIEFIGNSITAAMASDTKDIPCGTGKWYDQHNAYWSYATRIARTIGADFQLSAVSGIGIYRNWNSLAPTMPQVYESAYLEIDSVQRWDFSRFAPDVVSICLGTNDFSDGDGKSPRLAFDSAVYIKTYVEFLGMIYKHYPSTQVALLTSPMLSGAKGDLMYACLQSVKTKASEIYNGKPEIVIFRFNPMTPKGCSYHPDLADHEVMAKEAEPFFRKLLEK